MSVERQQGGAYQLDLFDEALMKTLRPERPGDGGTGAGNREERQALAASAEQRALMWDVMERVASSANLNQAYKRVKANRGAPGVDGMTVDDLGPWLVDHKDELVAQLVRGTYQPQPVKGRKTPKPGGGVRQLGIPPGIDRLGSIAWSSRPYCKSYSRSSTRPSRRRVSASARGAALMTRSPKRGRTLPRATGSWPIWISRNFSTGSTTTS